MLSACCLDVWSRPRSFEFAGRAGGASPSTQRCPGQFSHPDAKLDFGPKSQVDPCSTWISHDVAHIGTGVIGYIPGYLSEEGYANGNRFALLSLFLPTALAAPAAVALLVATAAAVARVAEPNQPWRGAVIMTGAAMLIATPSYPWYAILLALLVAFDGRAEWLSVAFAGYVALYAHDLHLDGTLMQRIGYGAALSWVLFTAYVRRRRNPGSRGGDRHDRPRWLAGARTAMFT
jgi:hypothetical protein